MLADVNPDLIGCYLAVRDDVEEVIRALKALAREHRRAGPTCYYYVRERVQSALAPPGGLRGLYTPEMAAMLIYLNRTGFNGLFRQNRDGAFNVPAGRYVNPRICDPDHLRSVATRGARGASRSNERRSMRRSRRPDVGISSIAIRPMRHSAERRASRTTRPADSNGRRPCAAARRRDRRQAGARSS